MFKKLPSWSKFGILAIRDLAIFYIAGSIAFYLIKLPVASEILTSDGLRIVPLSVGISAVLYLYSFGLLKKLQKIAE